MAKKLSKAETTETPAEDVILRHMYLDGFPLLTVDSALLANDMIVEAQIEGVSGWRRIMVNSIAWDDSGNAVYDPEPTAITPADEAALGIGMSELDAKLDAEYNRWNDEQERKHLTSEQYGNDDDTLFDETAPVRSQLEAATQGESVSEVVKHDLNAANKLIVELTSERDFIAVQLKAERQYADELRTALTALKEQFSQLAAVDADLREQLARVSRARDAAEKRLHNLEAQDKRELDNLLFGSMATAAEVMDKAGGLTEEEADLLGDAAFMIQPLHRYTAKAQRTCRRLENRGFVELDDYEMIITDAGCAALANYRQEQAAYARHQTENGERLYTGEDVLRKLGDMEA